MTWHNLSEKETLKALSTDREQGLSEREAAKRLKQYGENRLAEKKRKGFLKRFLEQFNDFMIIVLLAAAAVSFGISLLNGDADFADPIIILVIVVMNALIGVIQESKAEKSLEALKKICAPTALVRREGAVASIPAAAVVPGDIIILKTGAQIPADCRLLEAVNLTTDESALTGESMPVSKNAQSVYPEHTPLADRKNMALASSAVTGGRGTAVVTATGMQTEMGKIAQLILSTDSKETPLQKKLSDVGKVLGIAALAICAVIFIIGVFEHIPPFEMFMISVSLAVAAIPEGLPAIVTIMLAIGVSKMAQKGSIIRNIPSVETLG
ncbi:MAG TPA: HAD-IC family P-type ATPase, partial [Candidatus Avimonoglobus intestinipullorum]|nr:HAD-IC family P-type ATPase [Candidatus Avimonoglobus intestinipullorum]